jgi:hypothetical protein
LTRAEVGAERLAEENPDDPNDRPPDAPRISPLVLREACGVAVVSKRNVEQSRVMKDANC